MRATRKQGKKPRKSAPPAPPAVVTSTSVWNEVTRGRMEYHKLVTFSDSAFKVIVVKRGATGSLPPEILKSLWQCVCAIRKKQSSKRRVDQSVWEGRKKDGGTNQPLCDDGALLVVDGGDRVVLMLQFEDVKADDFWGKRVTTYWEKKLEDRSRENPLEVRRKVRELAKRQIAQLLDEGRFELAVAQVNVAKAELFWDLGFGAWRDGEEEFRSRFPRLPQALDRVQNLFLVHLGRCLMRDRRRAVVVDEVEVVEGSQGQHCALAKQVFEEAVTNEMLFSLYVNLVNDRLAQRGGAAAQEDQWYTRADIFKVVRDALRWRKCDLFDLSPLQPDYNPRDFPNFLTLSPPRRPLWDNGPFSWSLVFAVLHAILHRLGHDSVMLLPVSTTKTAIYLRYVEPVARRLHIGEHGFGDAKKYGDLRNAVAVVAFLQPGAAESLWQYKKAKVPGLCRKRRKRPAPPEERKEAALQRAALVKAELCGGKGVRAVAREQRMDWHHVCRLNQERLKEQGQQGLQTS